MNYLSNDLYDQITKGGKKNRQATNLTAAKLSVHDRMTQLRRSVVFSLPDQGKLFGERDTSKNIPEQYGFVLENFRLPYPETTLEFELSNRDRLKNLEDSLVYDALVVLLREVASGIELVMFFRHTKRKVWDLCNFGCTITPEGGVFPLFATHGSDQLYQENFKAFVADIEGEVTTVFEFLAALGCNNVSEQVALEEGRKTTLNKQRKNNKKVPLFEYKLLTIPGQVKNVGGKGGSHASPRTHLRRGHIRRLSSGKITWVNACVVRRDSVQEGVVIKDYAVKAV